MSMLAPDRPDILRDRFEQARAAGDHAVVLDLIDAMIAAGAGGPEVVMDRAEALAALGRGVEAEAVCQAALAQEPSSSRAMVTLYQVARGQQNPAKALAWLFDVVEVRPEDLSLRLDQAELLIELGRNAEAMRVLEALRPLHSHPVDVLMRQGHLARRQGDRAAALGYFVAARDAAPDHADVLLELAWELAGQRREEEASALAQALRDTGPTDGRTWLRLGHIARLMQLRALALTDFRQAHRLAPEDDDIRLWLATESREQGLLDEAATLLAGADASLRAWLERGHLARAAGDKPGALDAYRGAVDAHPKAPDAWLWRSLAELALADPQAEDSLHRALALDPDHIEAGLHLAGQSLERGAFDVARDACRHIRARFPQVAAAWLIETRVEMAARGGEVALALIDAAEHVLGPQPELLARRIDALMQVGLYVELRALLPAQMEMIGQHPDPFVAGVMALLRLGEREQMQALLGSAPPFTTATTRMRAMLAFLRGLAAETGWDHHTARQFYTDALAIDPELGWIAQDLARTCLVLLDGEAALAALGRFVELTGGERLLRGEQNKASRTTSGMILNEYRIAPALLAELRTALHLPAQIRLQALRACIARDPDSTSAAATLILALRSAGLFRQPTRTGAVIPKRIVLYWSQGRPPPDIAGLMQSWRVENPDHSHLLLNDAAAMIWLRNHSRPEVLAAFQRATQIAQRSDLLRLAVLAVQGGYYADADDRCVGPLSAHMPSGVGLVLYQEDFATLGNNFIGCTPGHPIIRRALDLAVVAVNGGDTESLWLMTGPGLITRAAAQHIAAHPGSPEAALAGIAILDRAGLSHCVAMHCHAVFTSTNDHWLRRLARADAAGRQRRARFALGSIGWTQRMRLDPRGNGPK